MRLRRLGSSGNLLTTILFLAIIITCGLTPMQGDTWWQLRAGQDMWATKSVLLTDTYSHTAYGAAWPNHEWLAEAIFFGVYRIGGLALLTLFAASMITASWALAWRLIRAPTEEKFVWVALALVPSAVWWQPRPHVFSLLFIVLTVSLLVRRRYWWIPPVFVVWANCHGGVLLGFVLLGAGAAAQALVDPGRWRHAALLVGLCALAMTATPLGISFWTEIPMSLSRISQYTFDEWRRPGLTEVAMLPFWGIAIALVVMLLRRLAWVRQATTGEAPLYACALVLLPGAISSIRHVGPFVMLAVPAITLLVHRERPQPTRPGSDKPIVNLCIMVTGAIAVALILAAAYSSQWPRLKWHPIPQSALEAVARCPGNLYNRYDEGGYLLWFAQNRKVFLDGRQDPYPAELVIEHIEMETGKRRDFAGVFDRYQIECAFLPVSSPTAAALTGAGWKTSYRDRRWVVFTK